MIVVELPLVGEMGDGEHLDKQAPEQARKQKFARQWPSS
jgi:hypothetical protein